LPALLVATVLSPGRAAAGEPRAHRVNSVDDPFERDVSEAEVSPDGEWIVWIQLGSTPELARLYSSRRWEGSPVLPLTAQLAGYSSIQEIEVTSDSRWVVFSGLTPGTARCEIWSVRIDGSSVPGRLSPAGEGGCESHGFALSGWVPRAVFLGDFETPGTTELWSARADRNELAVKLSPAPVANGDVSWPFVLTEDGTRVLFVADALVDDNNDLWMAPVDGGATAIRLDTSPSSPRHVVADSVTVARDGARVLYLEHSGFAGRPDLWSAPVDGSATPVLLTTPAETWRRVRAPAIDPTSSVAVFAADQDEDGWGETWSVPVAGPASSAVRLLEASNATGDLGDVVFERTGASVAFIGDFSPGPDQEAWVAATVGSPAPVEVSVAPQHTGGVNLTLLPADADTSVVIAGDSLVDNRIDLWGVLIGGPGLAVRLDATPTEGTAERVRAPAGGSRVIFVDVDTADGLASLWSASVDGAGSPVRLSIDPVPGGSLNVLAELDPTGRRVVYAGDLETPGTQDAWSAPVEGPATSSSKLTPALAPFEDLLELAGFSRDGLGTLLRISEAAGFELWIADWMVFRADFEEGDGSEWSTIVRP
jgi:hypothetical protein